MLLGPLGLAACLVRNPEFGDAGATGEGSTAAASTSAASSGATASGEGTSTGGSGGGSASATGTGGTGEALSTSGAVTTSTGATTEASQPPTRLQHYADGKCATPLWCFMNGQISQGTPVRIFAQECFTGVTPPFRVSRIGYWIAATEGTPSDPVIELRGFDGTSPSASPLVPPAGLGGGDVSPGYHEVALDWVVMTDAFCIGLAGGDLAQGTALGVAVDDVVPPLHQSFYRVDGVAPCDSAGQFRDTAVAKPTPTAQWCVDVDIAPL